ncbi:MAG TPA: hypothetical protein DDZ39_11835 [Flavobacteriaceae bacterium]|jgi:hypothetical protein|nr:hypothetical protein [Flavobacteriaceae bacterium]HBS12243.1 hypothetical protein [Flavobacteriaceae bacterium]
MKKIIFAVIMLLFTMNSCVDQGSSDIEFTLFNQTDKTVKVIGSRGSSIANPIIIKPKSNFKVTRATGMDDTLGYAFYSIEDVNSVRVIFNNEKVKVYGVTINHNPCDICDGSDNHQYFITEEDYNSAEDCNGDCE